MRYIFIIYLLFFISSAQANNVNIKKNLNLDLNCKFEKVILKNTDHNFVVFNSDQIKRKNIKKLIIKSENPNILVVKNQSKFLAKTNLEVKVTNEDIVLIKGFSEDRNYSESAVFTIRTGELIHEITKNIKGIKSKKEKDVSFFNCVKSNDNI